MKILITGSNGQLGSELSVLSKNFNASFIFTDKEELDITNAHATAALITSIKPDFIINAAAYTAVDKAESESETAYLINAKAVENLAAVSKKINAKLIHISTDFVFDGTKNTPYSEDDAPNPLSVYGKSKLQGEQVCLQQNTEAIIIRTSWLYSSFGNNFVKTILRLASEKKELRVVHDQKGTPTYARDLAHAILHICRHEKVKSTSGIFHYSNEGACTWFEFASEIVALSEKDCQVIPIKTHEYPTAAVRPKYSVLDKNKIASTFGLSIPEWKNSLKACLQLLTPS
jgi:dTDP-4-dehydrorhamnose reductase